MTEHYPETPERRKMIDAIEASLLRIAEIGPEKVVDRMTDEQVHDLLSLLKKVQPDE